MELLSNEIKERLTNFPLYSQDGKGEDAIIICKFFTPMNGWTWYVLEGEKQNEDFIFFGFVVSPFDREYGYFSLSELESLKSNRIIIERDTCMTERKIGNINNL